MARIIKGKADFFSPGDWNAVCSMCGRKRKASTLVKNWMGQYRCPEHNEARHPQDFVKGVQEHPEAPWVQDMPADHVLYLCNLASQSGWPGIAIPGCSRPGNTVRYIE